MNETKLQQEAAEAAKKDCNVETSNDIHVFISGYLTAARKYISEIEAKDKRIAELEKFVEAANKYVSKDLLSIIKTSQP